MCKCQTASAGEAMREARKCCERIASVLQEAIVEAEQLDDGDMLDRLAAASAAADRAGKLVNMLCVMLQSKQSSCEAAPFR